MNIRVWADGTTVDIDPDARLFYEMDFTAWLEGGTIASATTSAVGCTVGAAIITGNVVRFLVSDVATRAVVTVRVVTADGQEDDFALAFWAK